MELVILKLYKDKESNEQKKKQKTFCFIEIEKVDNYGS